MQPTTRAAVTVTFLRMDAPPAGPARPLPSDTSLVQVAQPSLAFYRFLYATVGGPYLWWLRRAMADDMLAGLLAEPGVSVWVLYRGGEPAGFYELDARALATVNLSYFGLMPSAVGRRMGTAFLRAAVDGAWASGPRAITVNTCTADHPNALPGYLAAGFRPTRTVREVWDVPAHLGLRVPAHLTG